MIIINGKKYNQKRNNKELFYKKKLSLISHNYINKDLLLVSFAIPIRIQITFIQHI